MVWSGLAAAGISAAAQIGGGFLSRPDLSERDLMWESQRVAEHGFRNNPRLQMEGLRSAGINPMLPFVRGEPAGGQQPGIPARMLDPVGEAVGRAGSSAVQAFRVANEIERTRAETQNIKETNRQIRATTENIAANTALTSARTISESEQPSLLNAIRDLNSAKSDRERQLLQKDIVETAIAREELTIAEKDAIVAAIDIDVYASSVGELSRWFEKLGVSGRAAVGFAHMIWSYMRTKRR